MKLFYRYMAIFLNFSPTLTHLHSLQVENCDSNSRLVANEDGNGKFRAQGVEAIDHFRYVSGFSYAPVASISVISAVFSGC